jgi:hypothetical protein
VRSIGKSAVQDVNLGSNNGKREPAGDRISTAGAVSGIRMRIFRSRVSPAISSMMLWLRYHEVHARGLRMARGGKIASVLWVTVLRHDRGGEDS